jgi:hypothetical protein
MSALPIVEPRPDVYARLRLYNAAMGFLHLVQGVAVLILSTAATLPITTSYVRFTAGNKGVPLPHLATLGHLRLGLTVAVFFFMSAAAHFCVATVAYDWYVRNLGKGANYARWIEYAFSSSVMIVLIAMLSGMYDLSSLILIFALNAMMILFGWMMELHNQTTEKTNWTAFAFGCLAGIVPWVAIALFFFNAQGPNGGGPPGFVYGIMISLFVFFNVFAVNMVLQYKKVGRWRDYLYGEKVYILLSLVGKSLLAWQVFAGTLR